MKKYIFLLPLLILMVHFHGVSQIKNIGLVVSLTGSVIDHASHKPVSAPMEAYDETGKRVYAGKSNAQQKGYYFMTGLKPGKKYYIQFVGLDYINTRTEVEIPETDKYTEYSKDLLAIPKQVGSEYYIHIPIFESNKSRLRFNAAVLLDEFKEALLRDQRVNIDIVCYPDNTQDAAFNKKLTEERCNSIKNFFVASGIKAERMNINPKDDTDTKYPPPQKRQPKGKNYIGSTYFVITKT